jgi:hypothetical protein
MIRRLAIAAILLLPATQLEAQERLEYQVKAAFLLNFTRFIEWPANSFSSASAPFTICVFGKDPFGRVLEEAMEGESVNGRRLEVRRLSEIPQSHGCQMVYFSALEKDVLESASGRGVLLVGEGEGFVRAGGAIGFVIDHRRVRFDINQTAAENAGLKLSSKLLNVARIVNRIGGEQHR